MSKYIAIICSLRGLTAKERETDSRTTTTTSHAIIVSGQYVHAQYSSPMKVCIGSCNGSVQWKCALEIRISTQRKWLTLMSFCIHHSLLPFIIYYCPSLFTATLPHSLLSFIIHYYPLSFTATFQLSLLPFIIHCYHCSFNTTLHLSLLHFRFSYYLSSLTATL